MTFYSACLILKLPWQHKYTPTASLQRGRTPPLTKCTGYDIKLSDGKASALEIWGMWSTPSLPLLLGPLWPKAVAPDRVQSMGQINCKQITDVKFWLLYRNTWNHATVCKKNAQACLRMLATKCVYKWYMYKQFGIK